MTETLQNSMSVLQEPGLMYDIVKNARLPVCVTDPNAPDNPIVFVNHAFTTLTGYSEEELIGRNCRLLQGPETTPESIAQVRAIIDRGDADAVDILNYRKDGSTFVNSLQIGPIHDADGKLIYFLGSQLNVTREREIEKQARALAENEMVHRLRNIVNVMSVIMRMTAKEHDTVSEFSTHLIARLTALSLVHFPSHEGTQKAFELQSILERMLLAYAPGDERQFALSGPGVILPNALASTLSLTIHELATNSVKHGALGDERGRVALRWDVIGKDSDRSVILTWEERDGPPVAMPDRFNGSRIVTAIVAASDGTLDFDWRQSGLVVTLKLPLGESRETRTPPRP